MLRALALETVGPSLVSRRYEKFSPSRTFRDSRFPHVTPLLEHEAAARTMSHLLQLFVAPRRRTQKPDRAPVLTPVPQDGYLPIDCLTERIERLLGSIASIAPSLLARSTRLAIPARLGTAVNAITPDCKQRDKDMASQHREGLTAWIEGDQSFKREQSPPCRDARIGEPPTRFVFCKNIRVKRLRHLP